MIRCGRLGLGIIGTRVESVVKYETVKMSQESDINYGPPGRASRKLLGHRTTCSNSMIRSTCSMSYHFA